MDERHAIYATDAWREAQDARFQLMVELSTGLRECQVRRDGLAEVRAPDRWRGYERASAMLRDRIVSVHEVTVQVARRGI